MTSKEEIQKTFIDCKHLYFLLWFRAMTHGPFFLADRMGLNGFEKAHTWKSKIGGL